MSIYKYNNFFKTMIMKETMYSWFDATHSDSVGRVEKLYSIVTVTIAKNVAKYRCKYA